MASINFQTVPLQESTSLQEKPGDFSAVFNRQAGVLEVPARIMAAARKSGVGDSLGLLSLAKAFPGSIAQETGWSVSEAVQAANSLEQLMIRENLYKPDPNGGQPAQPVYGAMDPRLLKP